MSSPPTPLAHRSDPDRPPDDLSGRRAVVTGGSHGIGAATVTALVAAGARVATCGRDPEALTQLTERCESLNGSLATFVADVAEWHQLDAFLADAERWLGAVDVLVNNAGETAMRDFLNTDEADWERCLRVNLIAAVRASRTVLPGMVARRWGRVIMMSSSGAKYPTPMWIDYAAAKAALATTAKALAREFGRHNVLVNTLLPGLIDTPMTRRSRQVVGAQSGMSPDEIGEAWAADVPLGRWGRPEEIANIVLFLCTERCTYLNGVALDVDGGLATHVF